MLNPSKENFELSGMGASNDSYMMGRNDELVVKNIVVASCT